MKVFVSLCLDVAHGFELSDVTEKKRQILKKHNVKLHACNVHSNS